MAQQQGYPQDNPAASPPPGPLDQQAPAAPGGRKKRQYAGQAYEFGAGGNAPPPGGPALAAQQPGGYDYHHGAQQPGFAGADYQASQPAPVGQPQYGQQPAYGQPQPGYAAPAPAPGAAVGYQANTGYAAPPDIGSVTAGVNQMNVGGPPQQAQRQQLNPLYPSDMLNQQFQVSELDIPPPAIIIPPNVRSFPRPLRALLTVPDVSNTVNTCELPPHVRSVDA